MNAPTLSLSERLNKLFEANRAAHEAEESNDSVADALAEALGRHVPVGSIDVLRSGRDIDGKSNDLETILALAAHFDAPGSYLLTWDSTAVRFDRELSLLIQMRDSGVLLLAMRDGGDAVENDLIDILKQLPEQPISEEK